MKNSFRNLAIILVGIAIFAVFRNFKTDHRIDCEPAEIDRSKSDRMIPPRSTEGTVAIPFLGRLKFKDVVSDFPPGPWLKNVDPFASPEVADSTATPFSEEEMAAWVKPSVYYGENGEIVCAIFDSGLSPTVSLEGIAEQRLGAESGLSIVRHGFPADIDVTSANAAFLKHSLDYWRMGAESHQSEYVIAPVIARVISTSRPLSGSRDSKHLGNEIPMILVRYGRPFSDDQAILTNSRFDEVPVKNRVRRHWIMRPYLAEDEKAPFLLPSVSGGVVLDEPELMAWEKIRTATKPLGK